LCCVVLCVAVVCCIFVVSGRQQSQTMLSQLLLSLDQQLASRQSNRPTHTAKSPAFVPAAVTGHDAGLMQSYMYLPQVLGPLMQGRACIVAMLPGTRVFVVLALLSNMMWGSACHL